MTGDPGELHSLRSLSPISLHNPASQAPGHGTRPKPPGHHDSDYVIVPTNGDRDGLILEEPSGSLRSRFFRPSWTLEILSWLLGAVTLAILIIALAIYNKTPLSRWHSNVSVNTVVNILTTIASIALIFPVASAIAQLGWLHMSEQQRPLSDLETFGAGPITMLVMVFKHPSRPLVYLGAANIVLLLLFSPITQETVDLPIRYRNGTLDSGSIPIVLAYQAVDPSDRTVGSLHYQSVSRSMGTAIVSGISGTPASPSNITRVYVFDQVSTENFSDSVVALKGSLELCLLSYTTRVVNGITQTVEVGRNEALAWQTKSKQVCDNGTHFCDVVATSTGVEEYWMDSGNKKAFNQYLGLEIFRGYSSFGLHLVTSDETGLIDTSTIIAGLLVNKTISDGQEALTRMLDNLAVGMTNSLRETAGQKDKAAGVAAVPEIHIAVQFRWLAAPIASVILSFIFLAAIIFKTSQRGVPPWKMSPIAAVLSLDHQTAQLINNQDHNAPLSSRAKALGVRLGPGSDHGWILQSN
ncbi:MAG: hypothetical protein Q9184_003202 [Pyrenodesmia sp. 2 TL-2023]